MRFALFPGSADKNAVLAFCGGGSKVYFWDLGRLEAYWNYNAALKNAEAKAATAFSSTSSGSGAPTQPIKRPSFLIPYRHRLRGGAAVSAISRVRESSPTESSSSHHTGSDSHPSHQSASNHPTSNPAMKDIYTQTGEKPLSAKDLAKSKETWDSKYDMSNAWTNL
jgi:polycomb protein EED